MQVNEYVQLRLRIPKRLAAARQDFFREIQSHRGNLRTYSEDDQTSSYQHGGIRVSSDEDEFEPSAWPNALRLDT